MLKIVYISIATIVSLVIIALAVTLGIQNPENFYARPGTIVFIVIVAVVINLVSVLAVYIIAKSFQKKRPSMG